jgi:geranylgeranyl diphosphate synthase type II
VGCHGACWYTTIAPLRIGALIGSWGSVDPDALSRFGFLLGAAFQITDDLLNLTGGQTAYGKEIRGDLREGKRTLMIIHLLAVAEPPHRDALVALLGPETERRRHSWTGWPVFSCSTAASPSPGTSPGASPTRPWPAFPDAFRTAPRAREAEAIRHLIDYVVDRTR